MNYILNYYIKSKYLGFTKNYYHEFDSIEEISNFIEKHKKEIKDFEVYMNFKRIRELMEKDNVR